MPRRSSLEPQSLRISREFAPSRHQLRALALAFEQALPLIRRPLNITTKQPMLSNSDPNAFVFPSASGARR